MIPVGEAAQLVRFDTFAIGEQATWGLLKKS